jgi:cell division transport system permease protein
MKKKEKQIMKASAFDMGTITSGISTTLVLLLLGLIVFFVLTAHKLSVYVKENISVSVIIGDDMKENDILKLQKRLDKESFVRASEYISKADALQEQIDAMGVDPQEFLGYNPLRASIELKLHSDYANADSIAKIETFIKQTPHVQEVRYQEELINLVNDNVRNISLMLFALALLLTFISFALINNTVRLTIYSKRFLINTMKLVGAGWGFIRRPFLMRHIRIGLFAGIIASLLLLAAAWALMRYEPDLNEIITTDVLAIVVLSVILFGIIITGLCAYFSINKFLRMRASTLYHI